MPQQESGFEVRDFECGIWNSGFRKRTGPWRVGASNPNDASHKGHLGSRTNKNYWNKPGMSMKTNDKVKKSKTQESTIGSQR